MMACLWHEDTAIDRGGAADESALPVIVQRRTPRWRAGIRNIARGCPNALDARRLRRLLVKLSEGDEMAGGILHADFAGTVESGALGHVHIGGGNQTGFWL